MRCPKCRWKINYLILIVETKNIFSYKAKWNKRDKWINNKMINGTTTTKQINKWFCPECDSLITKSETVAYKLMRGK